MTTRESRILQALADGPEGCVSLAIELARPFVSTRPGKPVSVELPTPLPLARLFAELGATGVVGLQDRLVAPSARTLVDGKLRFAEENQHVCEWACDMSPAAGADPLVYYRRHRASQWTDEHIHLSTFLLRFALTESIFDAEVCECAPCLTDEKLARVLERMRLLPLAASSWPEAPTRLYCAGDALALVSPNGEGLSTLWVGADTRESLAFIEDLADGDWD